MRRPNAIEVAMVLLIALLSCVAGYRLHNPHPAPGFQPAMTVPGTPSAPAQTGVQPANCTVSGQSVPQDRPGWKLVYAEDFCGNVPVGSFSNCSSDQSKAGAFCDGLKQYPHWYSNWWAYPSGWPDTAMECVQHDPKCPGGNPQVGGFYAPEKVVSVRGGMLNIHLFRPAGGGNNAVATLVPRACMGLSNGLYTERLRVMNQGADQATPDDQPLKPGFKAAHEFNQVTEDDFPETTNADFTSSVSAFTHPGPGHDFSASWGPSWFTTTIIRQHGSVTYDLNDQRFGPVPDNGTGQPEDWIIQNESSIIGGPALPGTGVDVQLDWLACYVPAA